jgi:SHS family lactate transporter-like MFS transporter
MGRKAPLMISILWYSLCNFIAGFSPSFAFLFFFRALLGIGMGAEWPAGACWPRSLMRRHAHGAIGGHLFRNDWHSHHAPHLWFPTRLHHQ